MTADFNDVYGTERANSGTGVWSEISLLSPSMTFGSLVLECILKDSVKGAHNPKWRPSPWFGQ